MSLARGDDVSLAYPKPGRRSKTLARHWKGISRESVLDCVRPCAALEWTPSNCQTFPSALCGVQQIRFIKKTENYSHTKPRRTRNRKMRSVFFVASCESIFFTTNFVHSH